MLVPDRQWFDSIREQYILEARESSYAADEMNAFDEMMAFSFYDGVVNPLWLMNHAERGALYLLMTLIRPQVVIEIGARFAGSTFLFHKYAKKVYVIDIDPALKGRCQHLENVEVLIGDSQKIIPSLVERLNRSGEGWDFALVDGDHSADGVKRDLDALIKERPVRRAWIAMHDSFNPECRKGVMAANWSAPWVHCVDPDFVCGQLRSERFVKGQMWGGISLAEIRPEDRRPSTRVIKEGSPLMYKVAYRNSFHRPKSSVERLMRRARRLIFEYTKKGDRPEH